MKQRISHDQNSATEKRQGKGTEWNREDSKTLFKLFGGLFKSYIHLFPNLLTTTSNTEALQAP